MTPCHHHLEIHTRKGILLAYCYKCDRIVAWEMPE
jgi:hypothetical protein